MPKNKGSIKIISLNIEFNKHYDKIIPFFKREDADVLLLQEVLEKDLSFLQKRLKMDFAFTPLVKVKFPFGVHTLGVATFSRLRITKILVLRYFGNPKILPVIEQTEPHRKNGSALMTWVSKNSYQFCLSNIYFTWAPNGGPNEQQRTDLKKLLTLLSKIKKFVLVGDFNAPRGREIFNTLAKIYKDNIPSTITTTIDKNLHLAGDLQIVVDGLFTAEGYRAKNIKVVDDVSDHYAIVANIYRLD